MVILEHVAKIGLFGENILFVTPLDHQMPLTDQLTEIAPYMRAYV